MSVSVLSRAIKIFFSYATSAPKDKRLLDKLTTHLSLLKRLHLVDEWYDSAVSAGSTIVQSIEAHLNAADIIVLLISADFFASDRCYELEMQRALELSATRATRLIPVLLSPTDWHAVPLDQYGPLPADGRPVSAWHNIDAALTEVAKGIRRVVEELASRATGTYTPSPRPSPPNFPLYRIPYGGNPFFTDRETVLATLETAFASPQTPETPVLALHGLDGMGKTQVALAYSLQASRRYQTVLWLNASSRELLSTDVSILADELALPTQNRTDERQLFDAVKRWLQRQERWLLVLDQIEDLALIELLVPPQSHGHVLLTTHQQALGGFASPIPITSMDTDASVLFLLRRARLLPVEASLEQASAEMLREAIELVQELGGFPLALDQAGAYLEETGCNLATYLNLYRHERANLLNKRGRLVQPQHASASVTATLRLAFAQVAQKRAVNLDLLHLLAFLQPDDIPEELLTYGAHEVHKALHTLLTRPLALHEALAELRSFSLLHHGADRSTLCMHRIVQHVLIDTLSHKQHRRLATQVVRIVESVFPDAYIDTWTICERYLPQAQHCAKLIAEYRLTITEAALLLERLGSYCSQRACYAEAEGYLTQALHLQEQQDEPDPLDIALTLNTLGQLYHRQARYQEAERVHQRSLQLREETLGPNNPIIAVNLHNLAVVYGSQGRYEQAVQLYLRALALDEQVQGMDHPNTAKTLTSLGLMYYMKGGMSEAESVYQRALAIYERDEPADQLDLTYTLNSLGTLAEQREAHTQAEALYLRALAIRERILGAEHPDTAHSMNKLADVYEAQKNYELAEALYRRALAIGEQALGPEHPDVALFLNNLAFAAHKQQHYQQAEPLYLRALHIYEQALGPEHPLVANVLFNLGRLAHAIGDTARAEDLLRHTLTMRMQLLGPEHPDTIHNAQTLTRLLNAQNRLDEEE